MLCHVFLERARRNLDAIEHKGHDSGSPICIVCELANGHTKHTEYDSDDVGCPACEFVQGLWGIGWRADDYIVRLLWRDGRTETRIVNVVADMGEDGLALACAEADPMVPPWPV